MKLRKVNEYLGDQLKAREWYLSNCVLRYSIFRNDLYLHVTRWTNKLTV